MKKFIKNIIIFIVIIILCMICLAFLDYKFMRSKFNSDYQRSVSDKIKRAKEINEPKIILVGDSNLAFGIDSKLIEDALEYKVVNMGLHAGMGNPFNENLAKVNVNKGDIVILSHISYEDNDDIVDVSLAWKTINYEKEIWKLIRFKDYFKLFMSYPNYLRESFVSVVDGTYKWSYGETSYKREAFNEYGDIVEKPEVNKVDTLEFFKTTEQPIPKVSDKTIKRINKLNDYIEEKGATLLVTAYPIAYGDYSMYSEDDIDSFQNVLRKKLDCEVISDFKEYMYPYDYFYDTKYHLTDEAVKIMTNKLISDIMDYKNSKDKE